MTHFRTVIHMKITSPPCELEMWANDGQIDDELGLFLVDIHLDEFFIGFMLDDTTIASCCHFYDCPHEHVS